MAKFNGELQEKVIDLLECEFLSVTQTCKALGISRQIFYKWINEKPEFRKEVDQALKHRNEELLAMAYSSIKKRLREGVTVVEKDVYIPDELDETKLKFKSRTITTKDYMPDLRTVKMVFDRSERQSLTSLNDETKKQTGEKMKNA